MITHCIRLCWNLLLTVDEQNFEQFVHQSASECRITKTSPREFRSHSEMKRRWIMMETIHSVQNSCGFSRILIESNLMLDRLLLSRMSQLPNAYLSKFYLSTAGIGFTYSERYVWTRWRFPLFAYQIAWSMVSTEYKGPFRNNVSLFGSPPLPRSVIFTGKNITAKITMKNNFGPFFVLPI